LRKNLIKRNWRTFMAAALIWQPVTDLWAKTTAWPVVGKLTSWIVNRDHYDVTFIPINEELSTVNAELQAKVADLSRANNDMNNLLAGTGVGTLFVDMQLRITRFTPAVTQVINLIQTDIGRPVSHLVSNLEGYDRLVEDVKLVLDSLVPREAEVRTKAGEWFLMRIRPYRTLENVIEGAVITFVDISDRKRLEGLARLAAIIRDSSDAIMSLDLDGHIQAWNRGAERLYGWSETEALRMNILDLTPAARQAETQDFLRRLRRRGRRIV
jgi:two-component system CheB/CheR fusion protein